MVHQTVAAGRRRVNGEQQEIVEGCNLKVRTSLVTTKAQGPFAVLSELNQAGPNLSHSAASASIIAIQDVTWTTARDAA